MKSAGEQADPRYSVAQPDMRRNWRKLPWHLRYRTGARIASELRRVSILLTHRHCTVEFRGPVRLGRGFTLAIPDRGTFIVGRGVDFRRGFRCEIEGDGRVEIGDGAAFTADALIQCSTTISIGNRCVFGQSVFIGDGNHEFRDWTKHLLDQGYNFRPITIEDGAIVMSKCTILNNLGRGAVVGAHSVVTKPIPAYCVAVGAPAKVVEYFGPPEMRPADLPIDA
jgi:acetyltransferase-like isoleucine patch superfamily enzyme